MYSNAVGFVPGDIYCFIADTSQELVERDYCKLAMKSRSLSLDDGILRDKSICIGRVGTLIPIH